LTRRKVLISVLAASLLAAGILVALNLSGGPLGEDSGYGGNDSGAGAYSRSALGFLLLHDILREAGFKVERRLPSQGIPTGASEAVVITRPEWLLRGDHDLGDLGRPGRLLIVLPKWDSLPDPAHRGWVGEMAPDGGGRAQGAVAFIFGGQATRRRLPEVVWADPGKPFPRNSLGVAPAFGAGAPVQLLQGGGLTPLISNEDGILLAEFALPSGKKAWILSDPDALSNLGLLLGDNLGLAMALFGEWAKGDPRPTIVFHDPATEAAAPARPEGLDLLRFLNLPNLIVAILTLLASLLLAFFGMHRFWPEGEPKPGVAFGKLGLIRNSARLIATTGREREIFLKWLSLSLEGLGRLLHAPRGVLGDRGELLAFLDHSLPRVIPGAILPSSLWAQATGMAGTAPPQRLIQCALEFYRWKETLESEPGTLRKDNPRPAR
jgi:hypothetical protein